jgi:hypothetical protein
MEIKIEKQIEVLRETAVPSTSKLYNPAALDHRKKLRMKCIEFGDDYTRIDFIYRSSTVYQNGGWIQMDGNAYSQLVQLQNTDSFVLSAFPLRHSNTISNIKVNITPIHSFFLPYLPEHQKLTLSKRKLLERISTFTE